MRRAIFLILLFVFLSLPSFVLAETTISNAFINTDQTWTASNSPYIINRRVSVLAGNTLTIEPGVVVKFGNDSGINVYGSIVVGGTAEKPVYFTSIHDDSIGLDTNGDGDSRLPSVNDSWGLNINKSPHSSFSHLNMRYSDGGIFMWETTVPIDNLNVENCGQGVFMAGGGELTVTNSTFKNITNNAIAGDQNSSLTISDVHIENVWDWEAVALSGNSHISIKNSTVLNTNFAYALGLYGANAEVENSVFSGGLSYGIALFNTGGNKSTLTLRDSTVEEYLDGGVGIFNSEVLIERSFIRNNMYGIWANGGYPSIILESSLYGNLIYAIESHTNISIDAKNNWWGDESGPFESERNPEGFGDEVHGNVDFEPWLKEDPTAISTIDPVIIIPGIMGSATKNGKLLIDPILHTYDDLIATLKANGYEEGKDLFTFPYEWRDSNIITANLLKDKINQVKQTCIALNLLDINCDKVDLVAHSMGGLVAREYIQSGQYQNDVDQLIFLGTPHKGSPQAYLQWEGGEFPPGIREFLSEQFFVSEAHRNGYKNIFDYIHSRPIKSVQELLPIFDYLKDKDTDVLRTYPNNYPRNMFLEYLNSDISKLLNSGIKITNIIGNSGNNTIEKIRVVAGSDPLWVSGKPDGFDGETADRGLERGSGDGTVTTFGSTLDSSIQNEEWSDVSHNQLPRETSARIFNLLTSKNAENIVYSAFIEKILSIQLQSPIDVVITAPDGKKIGKNFATGEEYNEIPDAFYSGFNNRDDEYITIPNPLDGEYKIEIQGTENGGEYGVLTSYISDDFATTIEVVGLTKPNQITELEVVVDNQNPANLEIERKVTLEVLINDINGAYDLGWIKNIGIKTELTQKIEKIFKDNKKADKDLTKALLVDLSLYEKEKINELAYNIIKEDLNWLILNN